MGGDRGGGVLQVEGDVFCFAAILSACFCLRRKALTWSFRADLFDIDFVAGASMFKSDQFRDERVCSCYLARSTSAKK